MSARHLALYLSPRHPCSYLSGRTATNAFVDPRAPMNSALYARLATRGFRRSGGYVYRPACDPCTACTPARIRVSNFRPRRAQRRIAQYNVDLEIAATAPVYREEQFDLYRRYLHQRHDDGEMDPDDPDAYLCFLSSAWSDTVFYEFRTAGRLIAVAVVDHLPDALSAVYTFFDPDAHRRSPGTFAILSQIAWARATGLSHVYLGYWIAASPKMSYKAGFHGLEILREGRWRRAAGEPGVGERSDCANAGNSR